MELRDKIQNFGRALSAMVMPNIGAFIAWGLLTALFIPTGWWPNERLNQLVAPMLTYLLPLLIGYTAGHNVAGVRGGVTAAIATAGVIAIDGRVGLYCLVAVSACMSLMFPTIYGIALEGMGEDAKFGAAGLIMAILGGSVLPPVQAMIIDQGS